MAIVTLLIIRQFRVERRLAIPVSCYEQRLLYGGSKGELGNRMWQHIRLSPWEPSLITRDYAVTIHSC